MTITLEPGALPPADHVPVDEQPAPNEALRSRLTRRIAKESGLPAVLAERILDQTVAFLRLSAAEPGQSFTPSPLVDAGWHVFVLYTREYADFCDRIAGRFLHHRPSDEPGAQRTTNGVARTVQALRDHGFPVDELVWLSDGDAAGIDPCQCEVASPKPDDGGDDE